MQLSPGLAQQHRRTWQAFYPKQCCCALVCGDCKSVCREDVHRCKCSGTRLLSAGLAQQHRRTRQAVYPKHCISALVFCDCTPVCRVDLHRYKCSVTRPLSACIAQQHITTRSDFCPEPCCSALVFGVCRPVEVWIFIDVNAVSQDRFQLALHSSTEQQGVNFALNPAAVHW